MTAELTEFHDELRAVASDLLAKSGPEGPAWSVLADIGWLGLEVPESLDGAGAGFAEAAVVLEEMGRSAAVGPYLGAVVLGAGALNLLAPNPDRDELVRRVASGDLLVAVALADGDRADDLAVASAPPFRLETAAGVSRVSGRAAFVPDVARADRLLLSAWDGDRGPVVVAVEPQAPGLDIAEQPLLDATRRFGVVRAEGVEVAVEAVWGYARDPMTSATSLLDRAALAVTIDSLGLSQAMVDATVAYARARQQFGRPIGSFQAVKHACADMAVQLAVSRELVAAAIDDVVRDELGASVAVSMAKSYVGPAAVDIAGAAMQLHGGIGYTWESGIHAYLKRAALNRSLFGSPRAHRRRLAQRYPG